VIGRQAGYSLYGLALRCPLILPCPRGERIPAAREVRLAPGSPGRFALARRQLGSRRRGRDWFRARRLSDGRHYLRWSGLFEFLISPDGRRIEYRRLPLASRESFATYLLSQVLSFSLIASGAEPLHGTVVVVDGQAVAFLGDCGSGKSTLAAAFLARGFPLLTDDLVSLDADGAGFRVHPGVPRIKLFPAVSRSVLGRAGSGPRLNPGTGKVVLPLGGRETFRAPAPLRAVYLIDRPQGPGTRIAPLSPPQAMVETVRHTFNTIVNHRERLARQFAAAAALARAVPLRRLQYPRQFAALPGVCDAVLADLRQ
jgi:hypothetical protein